jgi:integrase
MRAKVTKRSVEAVKPAQGDVFLWDTELPRFGVKVTPKGKRVFVVQYWAPNLHRVRRRVTLGAFGPLTVDQAREKATRVLGRVANGEDPSGEHSAEKRSAKHDTVEALSKEYLDYGKARFSPRTVDEYDRIFKTYINPALGRQPVAHVTAREIGQLHMEYRARPIQANRVLQLTKSFLYWCERRGLRAQNTNPCRGIEPYPESAKERFLTVAELARLGVALRTAETKGLPPAPKLRKKLNPESKHRTEKQKRGEFSPANPFAVAAIRFLLFTGWREQEALTLRWSWIDTERGLATLPRTKTGKSIRPLGAPALELLASLPRSDSPFVFPGMKPDAPLKEIKRVWGAVRHAAELNDVRLHDLRHTVASFSVGSGHSLYLTGALLGHARSETTQRYAHLADDARRATADSVAGALRAALDGSTAKVLSMKSGR